MYIYDNISPNSEKKKKMKNVSDIRCKETLTTHFMYNNFF